MSTKSKIEWTDSTWTPIRARNLKTGKVKANVDAIAEARAA